MLCRGAYVVQSAQAGEGSILVDEPYLDYYFRVGPVGVLVGTVARTMTAPPPIAVAAEGPTHAFDSAAPPAYAAPPTYAPQPAYAAPAAYGPPPTYGSAPGYPSPAYAPAYGVPPTAYTGSPAAAYGAPPVAAPYGAPPPAPYGAPAPTAGAPPVVFAPPNFTQAGYGPGYGQQQQRRGFF
ncbi:hypothetical protein APUTEX25_001912 [Auxenochlorella protothecoides]|uniref:Uncharacterized protein n=1 Tax=Auxenochlorella protothecoides TaxID=3075 RepID=A0A3M7L819_AUXPR|nr:hypothetical protein APUTEX25_001912 [Auxenochlorella protothecoides]|eukprot:RMZ57712.1 hypothetical protein APUTEX25_001912 [Auxenochlorella protothecoides]